MNLGNEMIEIHVEWKVLVKFIIAWFVLWPWFIFNRIRTQKNKADHWKCKCGEYIATDGDDWPWPYRWRDWLYTYTDVHPFIGEYSGVEWTSHAICWRCGRYHYFWDSSV